MGMYICPRCDGLFDSKGGDCIPALTEDGASTEELVNEDCATPRELFAYLPGFYDDPDEEAEALQDRLDAESRDKQHLCADQQGEAAQ